MFTQKSNPSPSSGPHYVINNTIWEQLYTFLRILVRYWVYSARLSLWHGQEEEITEDIVQEAISDTFSYALKHFCEVQEKDSALWKPLQRISATLAYKHYERQQQHDSSFVFVRAYSICAQGYALFAWWPDPLERTLQERYCDYLAGAILQIPVRPRTALLTYLANRLHLKTQGVSFQRALLKREVNLHNYQRLLPANLQEQNEHKTLFQVACQRLAQGTESEGTDLLERENETVMFSEPEIECAELDPTFLGLMVSLEMTAPSPYPDLSFRENLRDTLRTRFLQIVEERQREEEHEFALLETRLEAGVPPVLMDPLYRETLLKALQEKLRSLPIDLPSPPGVEEVLLGTTQAIAGLSKLSEEPATETEENWSPDLPLFV